MFTEKFLDALTERVADRVAKLTSLTLPGTSQRMFSIRDAAIYLGRSPRAVRHLIARGTLPIVQIDSKVQLDRRALDKLIDEATHYVAA